MAAAGRICHLLRDGDKFGILRAGNKERGHREFAELAPQWLLPSRGCLGQDSSQAMHILLPAALCQHRLEPAMTAHKMLMLMLLIILKA